MPKTYLVGGAVRDILLGLEPKDRDYVVVGADHDYMIKNGFEKVGADFPVYLKTGDEYALARTERKTGKGYNGFETFFDPSVTLEMDLLRRDFTVNSLAMDEDGNLLDPLGVRRHVFEKKLVATNPDSFTEDPVRVLRMARFMARFGSEWTVDSSTLGYAEMMGSHGFLGELTAERVWKELSRALLENHPRVFFDTLKNANVLDKLFPEVNKLRYATENPKWHPEGNSYEHTMLVLEQAKTRKNEVGDPVELMLSALVHDFGKGLTDPALMPKHHGHEVKGVPVAENFANKLKLGSATTRRLKNVTRYHMHMHKLSELNPKTFVKMFREMDAFRDVHMVPLLFHLGCSDARGRLGHEDADVSSREVLLDVFDKVSNVKYADVIGEREVKPHMVRDVMDRAMTNVARAHLNAMRGHSNET